MYAIYSAKGHVIVNRRAMGEWCQMPYPGHPKGCPNYDTGRPECPPNAPFVWDWIDKDKPQFFVVEISLNI